MTTTPSIQEQVRTLTDDFTLDLPGEIEPIKDTDGIVVGIDHPGWRGVLSDWPVSLLVLEAAAARYVETQDDLAVHWYYNDDDKNWVVEIISSSEPVFVELDDMEAELVTHSPDPNVYTKTRWEAVFAAYVACAKEHK